MWALRPEPQGMPGPHQHKPRQAQFLLRSRNQLLLRNRSRSLVRLLVEVPAPLCHVGVSGGELAALRPTTAAVTCRRCLKRQGADELAAFPANEQLPLFPYRRPQQTDN